MLFSSEIRTQFEEYGENREHQDVPYPGEFYIHMYKKKKKWWLNTGENWETQNISSLPDKHLLEQPGGLKKSWQQIAFFFHEKILNKDAWSAVFWEFHFGFLRRRKENIPHDQNQGKGEMVQKQKHERKNMNLAIRNKIEYFFQSKSA